MNCVTGEIYGKLGSHDGSVESVLINEELNLAITAGMDDHISIYEIKSFSLR